MQTARYSVFAAILQFMTLLYHSIVRDIRKADGNAVRGIVKEIITASMMVAAFYFMLTLMGVRSAAIRGNFILYIMSGIFLYMTHIKAMGGIAASGGPTNAMLKHKPVTTLLLICSSALSALYNQVLAIITILFITHVMIMPVEIYHLSGAAMMFLLAWFTGIAVGLVALSLTPFLPNLMPILTMVYQRANMIFSGKMFVASQMPAFMLPMFTWNPLFHVIDQARGFIFINYTARITSIMYPVAISIALMMIGMMIEHWGRKYASESWAARN